MSPDDEASAPIEAMQKLKAQFDGYKPSDIGVVEMSESSAAQAIALIRSLELDEDLSIRTAARWRAGIRLRRQARCWSRAFSRVWRAGKTKVRSLGIATLGVAGGMGVAALFEAV